MTKEAAYAFLKSAAADRMFITSERRKEMFHCVTADFGAFGAPHTFESGFTAKYEDIEGKSDFLVSRMPEESDDAFDEEVLFLNLPEDGTKARVVPYVFENEIYVTIAEENDALKMRLTKEEYEKMTGKRAESLLHAPKIQVGIYGGSAQVIDASEFFVWIADDENTVTMPSKKEFMEEAEGLYISSPAYRASDLRFFLNQKQRGDFKKDPEKAMAALNAAVSLRGAFMEERNLALDFSRLIPGWKENAAKSFYIFALDKDGNPAADDDENALWISTEKASCGHRLFMESAVKEDIKRGVSFTADWYTARELKNLENTLSSDGERLLENIGYDFVIRKGKEEFFRDWMHEASYGYVLDAKKDAILVALESLKTIWLTSDEFETLSGESFLKYKALIPKPVPVDMPLTDGTKIREVKVFDRTPDRVYVFCDDGLPRHMPWSLYFFVKSQGEKRTK